MTSNTPRARLAASVCGCVVLLAGCQALMPTPQSPYLLAAPGNPVALAKDSWTWRDARGPVPTDNTSTRDGLLFGETVLQPRPFSYVQAEFARAVAASDGRDELAQKLKEKTITLETFEASVGLWSRLSERQQSKWEFVRVRIVITIDGQRIEGQSVDKFAVDGAPSPLSLSAHNAVENTVQQILLFY